MQGPYLEVCKSFHSPVLLLSLLTMSASWAFLLFQKFHSCGFLAGSEESLYEVSELIGVLVFELWSDSEKKMEGLVHKKAFINDALFPVFLSRV